MCKIPIAKTWFKNTFQENLPDKQLHNFSVKLQNKKRTRRNSTASLESADSNCTCKPKEGVSMTCPVVVNFMVEAGLTEEAVRFNLLYC